MKPTRLVWLLLLIIGGSWLALRAWHGQMGVAYYRVRPDGKTANLSPAEARDRLRRQADGVAAIEQTADPAARVQQRAGIAAVSAARTVGVWVAALLTLAIFSFLYRDNPFYRLAEHIFVGVSAAYWMVVAFWRVIVPNLIGKLWPRWCRDTLLPGLDLNRIAGDLDLHGWLNGVVDYGQAVANPLGAGWWQLMAWFYWLPVLLGVMLLWRLAPKGAWIARWPLAYVVGMTAGFRLVGYLESDVVAQMQALIMPLIRLEYVGAGQLDVWATTYASLGNAVLLFGTTAALVYFFFSVEHRGAIGRVARVGIWVLMITFGAGFGYTVMGRITLLTLRFEFLCGDWLNLALH